MGTISFSHQKAFSSRDHRKHFLPWVCSQNWLDLPCPSVLAQKKPQNLIGNSMWQFFGSYGLPASIALHYSHVHIMTFWSTTDQVYHGDPIDYNRLEKFLSPSDLLAVLRQHKCWFSSISNAWSTYLGPMSFLKIAPFSKPIWQLEGPSWFLLLLKDTLQH